MNTPYELVASRLQNVRRNGKTFTARCPAHPDRNNSLSVTEAEDGRVLMKCFVGCDVSEIVAQIGLSMADLFPEQKGRPGVPSPQPCTAATVSPVTLAQYAAAKKLPLDFLRNLGLSDIHYCGQPAIRIPYLDEGRSEVAVRIRISLEKTGDEDNRFRWRKSSKVRLYGLWRKQSTDELFLCEGESDCHTLWFNGFAALGLPGAATWNEERDAAHFDGVDIIFVVIEPDKGGEAVKTWLAKSRIASRARLFSLPGFKDPSALFLDDPANFPRRLKEAMQNAVPVSVWLDEQAALEKNAAWERCKYLAQSENVLTEFGHVLNAGGVVGEERNAKIIYLALTSRFLTRPVSLAVKGPSSSGKSFLAAQVIRFFPESAVYCLTAMSERALAYTDADLCHRFLVICEAAGISGDFASYLVRSLLSEGKLVYEVVEKTADGLRARRMEKSGPTGLLVTTTAVRLHPENETRLLSLHVTDSQEQTRCVLLALAQGAEKPLDISSWLALQEWLKHAEHRVVVPFAHHLAEKTRPVSVRLRRDFGAFLALIKAHTILQQAKRQRDENGAVIATLSDYAAVRELVGTIVAEGLEATVSKNARETVEGIRRILDDGAEEVSLTALATVLKLDKSSTSRRVADAIHLGFLKNLEEKKGRPARLVLGDALPGDSDVLPTVEALQGCSAEPAVCAAPSEGNGTLDEREPVTSIAGSIQTGEGFVEAEL
jgi:hypothetical protein